MRFYDLYINDMVGKEDVYNFIEEWDLTDFGCRYELYDFLGMSKDLFYEWVENDYIKLI